MPIENFVSYGNAIDILEAVSEKFESLDYSESYVENFSTGINVKDYGAVGDGVTNDGQAFISAMDAATSAGKSVIIIPAGTYDLDHTAMNIAAFRFIGENREKTVLLNANITAQRGITCESLTFDGGTTRPNGTFDPGYSTGLMPYTVAIHCTPQYENSDVIYKNCTFRNVGIATVAFSAHDNNMYLNNNFIYDCIFEDIERIGVYHNCGINYAEIKRNIFRRIGSTDCQQYTVGALKLGDTSNLSTSYIIDGIVEDNVFDTLSAYYQTDVVVHEIACNFITAGAKRIIIRRNKFKNMDTVGNDREAIYTKGDNVEICYNILEDAGEGEAYIACKGKASGNVATRTNHVHHNIIMGDHGEGIRIYGTAVIHDNYIGIKKMRKAITNFNHLSSHNEYVDIYNNYIFGGIGEVYVNGTYISNLDPNDSVIHIFNALLKGIRVNHNFICIRRDDGSSKYFENAIKTQELSCDAEIKDNYVDCNSDTVFKRFFALSTNASYPEEAKKITIDIENNYHETCSECAMLVQFNASNTTITPTMIIKNNIWKSLTGNVYGIQISGPADKRLNVYYESNQAQNAFQKKHFYAGENVVDKIYSSLASGFFLASGSTLVSSKFDNYPRIDDTTAASNKVYSSNKIDSFLKADVGGTPVPFRFTYDSTTQKYGYLDGADTFHPFNDFELPDNCEVVPITLSQNTQQLVIPYTRDDVLRFVYVSAYAPTIPRYSVLEFILLRNKIDGSTDTLNDMAIRVGYNLTEQYVGNNTLSTSLDSTNKEITVDVEDSNYYFRTSITYVAYIYYIQST